jgi:tetratricopeptide (TPR) repeat protein
MYRILVIAWLLFLISCKESKSKKVTDPEAIKLNNQAVSSLNTATDINKGLVKAISILDQAIKVDGDYMQAYYNKFTFQNQLKRYADAIETGKQMIKLRPRNAELKMEVGETYAKAGDTTAAMPYFKSALNIYNKVLDTMSGNNDLYKTLKMEKAFDLIILHQEQQGYNMLNEIVANERNRNYKVLYQQMLTLKREDILNGKAVIGTAASEVY